MIASDVAPIRFRRYGLTGPVRAPAATLYETVIADQRILLHMSSGDEVRILLVAMNTRPYFLCSVLESRLKDIKFFHRIIADEVLRSYIRMRHWILFYYYKQHN
jgi:hypothetical protein